MHSSGCCQVKIADGKYHTANLYTILTWGLLKMNTYITGIPSVAPASPRRWDYQSLSEGYVIICKMP